MNYLFGGILTISGYTVIFKLHSGNFEDCKKELENNSFYEYAKVAVLYNDADDYAKIL